MEIGGQHTCLKHCLNEILHMMTMIKDRNMKTVSVFLGITLIQHHYYYYLPQPHHQIRMQADSRTIETESLIFMHTYLSICIVDCVGVSMLVFYQHA